MLGHRFTCRMAMLVIFASMPFRSMARSAEPIVSGRVATSQYKDVETKLSPLAKKLAAPKRGEWLYEHKEAGQSFAQYVASQPVQRSAEWKTIHICVIGDLSPKQMQIIETTRKYLEIFFDTPVKIGKSIPLADIPERAQRKHPQWGGEQVLTTYVLDEILRPNRPADALASLAFTDSDLWPGKNWNFVFGQASLRERTGVWSIHRNGNPETDDASYKLCLRRTLCTASHETGHILSMPHCTQFECSQNGSNNLEESDNKPLHLCPVCQRKLCWNLRVDPVAHLRKLEEFCRKHNFEEEVEWYQNASSALTKRE